jgi:hypothetical protein
VSFFNAQKSLLKGKQHFSEKTDAISVSKRSPLSSLEVTFSYAESDGKIYGERLSKGPGIWDGSIRTQRRMQ